MTKTEVLKNLLRLMLLHLSSQKPPKTLERRLKTIFIYKHIKVYVVAQSRIFQNTQICLVMNHKNRLASVYNIIEVLHYIFMTTTFKSFLL